jgi:hypothetical protein
VAGARQVDHVEAVLLDDPIEVDIDETLPRRGAPVAQEPGLDVLELEGPLQQRVVEQVDLPDRQVIRGAPVGVHAAEEFGFRRRIHDSIPPAGSGAFRTVTLL